MNTKINHITKSFVIVPMMATMLSMNAFTASINQQLSISSDQKAQTTSAESISLEQDRIIKAKKIDAYYAKHNLPLAGYGMKMVLAAEAHDIPWNLMPAIAMRESTGGKFACFNNPFGWGSCSIKFDSFDKAIESVARHLGGNHPKTASYYDGKTVRGILETYNPPSVVPTYASEVMAIMSAIERVEV
jgi:hypothetical protein